MSDTTTPEPAQIDLEVVNLVGEGLTYAQIAKQLDISRNYAFLAYQRGIAALTAGEDAAARARRYIDKHLGELEAERAAVQSVINGYHVVVNNGHVVSLANVPLEDQGPLLSAVDRMVKIREQEANLLGIKAKTEVSMSGVVRYVVEGVTTEELT